jgi:hypothetical protein
MARGSPQTRPRQRRRCCPHHGRHQGQQARHKACGRVRLPPATPQGAAAPTRLRRAAWTARPGRPPPAATQASHPLLCEQPAPHSLLSREAGGQSAPLQARCRPQRWTKAKQRRKRTRTAGCCTTQPAKRDQNLLLQHSLARFDFDTVLVTLMRACNSLPALQPTSSGRHPPSLLAYALLDMPVPVAHVLWFLLAQTCMQPGQSTVACCTGQPTTCLERQRAVHSMR